MNSSGAHSAMVALEARLKIRRLTSRILGRKIPVVSTAAISIKLWLLPNVQR